jgi:hypothetical protein
VAITVRMHYLHFLRELVGKALTLVF